MTNGKDGKGADGTLYCSFCGKSQNEVAKLIAGPKVLICNECVDLSHDIIYEDHKTLSLKADTYKLTPKDICAVLGRHSKHYPRARKILALAAFHHFHARRKLAAGREPAPGKANILLVGPAGCGKRLLAERVAQLLSAPYAAASAAALVDAETGPRAWQDVLDELLDLSHSNIAEGQRGIIYIDDFDKVCCKDGAGSHEDFQHALLEAIRGKATIVHFDNALRPEDRMWEFDTSNVQFILGGAFLGVEDKKSPVDEVKLSDFDKAISVAEGRKIAERLRTVSQEDLLAFGMKAELLTQIPYVATLRDLRN